MFGKIMSISDELMWRYFELLSFRSLDDMSLACVKRVDDGMNPRDAKFELAAEIVERFHGGTCGRTPRKRNLSLDFNKAPCPRKFPR